MDLYEKGIGQGLPTEGNMEYLVGGFPSIAKYDLDFSQLKLNLGINTVVSLYMP